MKIHYRWLLILFIVTLHIGSGIKFVRAVEKDYFPGKYPGKPEVVINKGNIVLYNHAISAVWQLKNNSIVLKAVENKFDNQVVTLENITLFAIELDNGELLSNLDFKLKGDLAVIDIQVTDSLPTKSLQFPGKKITGIFVSEDKNISIQWTAQLREESNYIRQNIQIKTIQNPVHISKVIFFNGHLEGASYSGSVLGSLITCKNFFFGFEHPTAHSKALLARSIGNVSSRVVNISNIIDQAGDYVIAIEHGPGSANFNINSVSLFENNMVISTDKHPLNGHDGSNLYHLNVRDYNPKGEYKIQGDIENISNAKGTFHIYRKTEGLLNFYVNRTDELTPGKSISEWSVIGVTPKNQKRRAFLYYLERERARPYMQFLHYNCWWDIVADGYNMFTSEQLIEKMHAWNRKFINPFGIQLQSFVFDDGWDNLDSVWYFDPVEFPKGFAPQAELCKKYNSGIGVWMSPFGGYSENKKHRIASAHREGLETNTKGLSLAGSNYYNRFLERALDMVDNYKVNYFKFDGFGGYEPQYLPDMEAGARIIKEVRKHNPNVFVNITVGSWPSPFWLQYADCTWRGSGDAYMAGQGSRTQKFMTYRDGTLYNNIVKRAPFYPLNSIMTAGIVYANLGISIKCVNDSIDDFKDMVRSFFGAGSNLQELYISHDRMKKDFWSVLAEAAKWAKDNQDVLKDVHWIGGSPINLEVYGFASWKPGKGIITLRNPGDKTIEFELNLKNVFELPDDVGSNFSLKSPWKEDENTSVLNINGNVTQNIKIEPYEVIVLEAYLIK